MNESQITKESTGRPNPWKRLPGWARGSLIAFLGFFLGFAAAAPNQEEVDKAKSITAKEQSIYAAAYVKRDAAAAEQKELLDGMSELEETADEKQAEAKARELKARRTLAKLRREIRGARTTISKSTFEGEGMYLVGDDIEPGTYKAESSSGCYWARLASGDTSDIVDNDNVDGPAVITVAAGDYAVQVSGCGTFKRQ